MTEFDPALIRLRPQRDRRIVSQGRTVLVTGRDGCIEPKTSQGLFVHQTRLVSCCRYLINNERPQSVSESSVEPHSWLGYYIAPAPSDGGDDGSSAEQRTIELQVARLISTGYHESLTLTNFTQRRARFTFAIEIDADFADQKEAGKKNSLHGRRRRAWKQVDGAWALSFDFQATHDYSHQEEKGTARIHRGMQLRVERSDSKPRYSAGRIRFAVNLEPQTSWRADLSFRPFIDGKELEQRNDSRPPHAGLSSRDPTQQQFLRESTSFTGPGSGTLTATVLRALERGRRDLAALRLADLDQDSRGWVPAAGLPTYVALFGRDTLLTALEAALVSPALLRGGLFQMANWQGTKVDDWRDEQPGRMLHQAQTSPLSVLNVNPLGRYYGSMTTSLLYPTALFAAYVTSGDDDLVRRYLPAAIKAIRWLDDYGDLNGDGFYEYTKRSEKGLKNQLWKDSGEAVVYADGSQVPDPIAASVVQALAYTAKFRLSDLLRRHDREDEARTMAREAEELKKRFNDRFWLSDQSLFAQAIDSEGHVVQTIASDAGACLATGIVDESLVRPTAERLMKDDLFTGWGIRTLSSQNPAYDPYSYQRGSVWPAETAVLALGFMRYGLHDPMERLCRAQFEAAALFDHHRLPELFAGHSRDADHPFPALYPQANWPQAWSAASVFSTVQALLGIFPFAPLHALVVDPHLPEWLPDITLNRLQIGDGSVDIRFFRTEKGTSDYEVLEKRGTVHVVRQPSPWSLTATSWERIKDLITSLL